MEIRQKDALNNKQKKVRFVANKNLETFCTTDMHKVLPFGEREQPDALPSIYIPYRSGGLVPPM
jgi:hypothetical protein